MAIDIRASVTSNLGRLISASISDDYLQNSGLIRCSGSCEIAGLISPPVGSKVTFQYTKSGITRTIPRTLRVLSSFADPFRRITRVELGCKLTYLADLTDPINWSAFDDPENSELSEEDQRIVVIPISAGSVANKCLQQLGISASSMPLTNKFSVSNFDFSAGYVNILSDLLVSESYFGYLDATETLQVRSLSPQGGSGPVFTASDLIDISGIGVGQLPGEAVVTTYSSLKLRNPEDDDDEDVMRRNWEFENYYGPEQEITITGTEVGYGLFEEDKEVEETFRYTPYAQTISRYDSWDRLVKKVTSENTIAAEANPDYFAQALQAGRGVVLRADGGKILWKVTETEVTYVKPAVGTELPEGYDEIDTETTKVYMHELAALGGIPINYIRFPEGFTRPLFYQLFVMGSIFSSNNAPKSPPPSHELVEVSETRYLTNSRNLVIRSGLSRGPFIQAPVVNLGNFPVTRTTTNFRKIYGQTARGQQDLVADDSLNASNTIVKALRLVEDGQETRNVSGREAALQVRPGAGDRGIAGLADGGDPNNGYRTESTSQLELAIGSPTAQRRIEFSMPYAPDDTFVKSGVEPNVTFTAIRSDAKEKAAEFGRTQNRLLLGNRNGMNIQVSPERMPGAPFSPIGINARGIVGLYRTNGTSWTMDANGILASTDALYWGVLGAS
jgi:hypothetical protein